MNNCRTSREKLLPSTIKKNKGIKHNGSEKLRIDVDINDFLWILKNAPKEKKNKQIPDIKNTVCGQIEKKNTTPNKNKPSNFSCFIMK